MPTWGDIHKELRSIPNQFDYVRRKYLKELHEHTGRNTIIYASKWTQPGSPPELITITEEDIQGFMEVIHGLEGNNLDLILHSPGGSPVATESLVSYLRSKFDDIRVIIPQAAMSAATMLACAANKIIMGKHSSLGPIDPQIVLPTPHGIYRSIPAEAIKEQFELAVKECIEDSRKIGPWLPILQQYGPALYVECINAINLSKELVTEWLKKYMFAGKSDAETLARDIAEKLSDYSYFKIHSRHIDKEKAKEWGLIIEDLESDQTFQDLILSVFHATTHTFSNTQAVKIIENHKGKAFIKLYEQKLRQS